MSFPAVRERAYAKLNLVLHVGRPRPDGMHPICSVFASIDLADDLHVGPGGDAGDRVACPGVEGPNLAEAALAAFRKRVPALPPLAVRIDKRIPVAAGLGGGSADAAAVLRAANRIAGDALDAGALQGIAAALGSDVPSQLEPRHALVHGAGELVEPLELPPLSAVLVPSRAALETAAVYAQLDRMRGWRETLAPERLRALFAQPRAWPAALENDLQPATLALRPELGATLGRLRATAPLAALVTGSGPTCFGVFDEQPAAAAAAAAIPGALAVRLRER